MKILVAPSNTDLNRGDQALVWESINVINQATKNNDIYLNITGSTPEEINAQKQQTEKLGYKFSPRILQHPGRGRKQRDVKYGIGTYFRWGTVALWDIISTSLLLPKITILNSLGKLMLNKEQRKALELFKRMDVILIKGGGFLHSYGNITDAYIAYFQLFDIFLGARYNKKLLVMPNSFGPFKNPIAKILILSGLRKCQLVTARENISQQLLQQHNIASQYYADLGFYLKPSERSFKQYLVNNGYAVDKKNVAVTLRPYRFGGKDNASQLYEQYIGQVTEALCYLIDNNYHISFIAHTLGPSSHENDEIALNDVMAKLNPEQLKSTSYIYDSELTCRDIEKIYSYYDFIIGTRFHSVIFALNVNTPAIAIGYGGNKSMGIMNDIGLQEYLIPIEEVNGQHIIKMSKCLEDQRAKYIDKLTLFKTRLSAQRDKLVELCREVIEK